LYFDFYFVLFSIILFYFYVWILEAKRAYDIGVGVYIVNTIEIIEKILERKGTSRDSWNGRKALGFLKCWNGRIGLYMRLWSYLFEIRPNTIRSLKLDIYDID